MEVEMLQYKLVPEDEVSVIVTLEKYSEGYRLSLSKDRQTISLSPEQILDLKEILNKPLCN